jgi:hypothetical protein
MSTREEAIIVWSILLIFYIKRKDGFSSGMLLGLFKSVLGVLKISVVKMVICINALLLVMLYFVFYRLGIRLSYWHIKDYIFIVGFTIIPSIITLYNDDINSYSKKELKGIFSLVFLTQFITGEYTFSLWVELIIVPVLFLLSFSFALSEVRKEWKDTRIFWGVTILIGNLWLLFFSIRKFVYSVGDLHTPDFWISFLLPFFILIANIPILIVAKYVFLEHEKAVVGACGKSTIIGSFDCFQYYLKQKKTYKSVMKKLKRIPKIKKVYEHNWDYTGSRIRIQIAKKNLSDNDLKALIFDAVIGKHKLTHHECTNSRYPAFVEIVNTKKETIALWESFYSRKCQSKTEYKPDSGIEKEDECPIGDGVSRVKDIKTYWSWQL